jgi:hypothetical protein
MPRSRQPGHCTAPDVDASATGGLRDPRTNTLLPPLGRGCRAGDGRGCHSYLPRVAVAGLMLPRSRQPGLCTAPDVDAPATGGLRVPRTNTLLPPRFFAPTTPVCRSMAVECLRRVATEARSATVTQSLVAASQSTAPAMDLLRFRVRAAVCVHTDTQRGSQSIGEGHGKLKVKEEEEGGQYRSLVDTHTHTHTRFEGMGATHDTLTRYVGEEGALCLQRPHSKLPLTHRKLPLYLERRVVY